MHRLLFLLLALPFTGAIAQQTQKPPLHGKHWMAITGKPLAATAGSMIFQQGGNAVDAACAMLAATCTMWDVLSWGGETQALIYHPKLKKVIAINALGVAPTGATPAFFKQKGYNFPPEYGPLAAVTPGTPGGLCYMLAEYGTLSLKEVLAPAMEMAAGYPMEAQTANSIERQKAMIREWPYSKKIFLTHPGEKREAPEAGEIFVQQDLLATLTKMVEAEQEALRKGKSRKEAIMAASERFYKGDIAEEFVRGCREQGGLITMEDLASWKPLEEAPLHVNYKGIDVYKLQEWTQGPALLQSLNILEQFDLQKMGYNSPAYIHTLYQTMNLAFADRDFYYGDPRFNRQSPIKGLLSKEYAKERAKLIRPDRNDPAPLPGDPYKYEGKANPVAHLLENWHLLADSTHDDRPGQATPKHDVVASQPASAIWQATVASQTASAAEQAIPMHHAVASQTASATEQAIPMHHAVASQTASATEQAIPMHHAVASQTASATEQAIPMHHAVASQTASATEQAIPMHRAVASQTASATEQAIPMHHAVASQTASATEQAIPMHHAVASQTASAIWQTTVASQTASATEQATSANDATALPHPPDTADSLWHDRLWRGTTTIEAADEEGWVVSITPSGGWIPACIAGRTGVGMSQRLQSFVLDSALNPFNVVAPGKRPRVTLTPSLALKNGAPFLAFGVQGGDTQDQNLLQFFLNVVEFGMTVQQASEAANINSDQLWLSLGGTTLKDRRPRPGSILLQSNTPEATRKALKKMGYNMYFRARTSGPINAIYIDREHGSLWGGSSNHGEDYGIGW